jgi:hypothetical protein
VRREEALDEFLSAEVVVLGITMYPKELAIEWLQMDMNGYLLPIGAKWI